MLARTKEKDTDQTRKVIITPPNFKFVKVRIKSTAPYVQNRMSQRAREAMEEAQKAGTQAAKKNRKRAHKDFDAAYRGAMHVSTEGWHGIPAAAFRNGMISACRTVGFAMTMAKQSVFVEAEGFDADDGQPLIRLHGKPVCFHMAVRLASGAADIAARPKFDTWWAEPTIKYDEDTFSATDVVNLLARMGIQVGIGAGRPDSKDTPGMGFGTFALDLGEAA